MHECLIYVLFDRTGILNYVGRTQNITRRLYEHKRVLGFKPTHRIIDRCSEDCRNVEKKWIGHYREAGYQLRNISYGQGPHFLPESSRQKLSAAFKGRPVTWGDKISAAQKGIPKNWSKDGLRRVRSTQFKKGVNNFENLSPEAKETIRESGRKQWTGISKKERSRLARERALKQWANRTPEQREAVAAKVRDGNHRHWKEK